MTLTLGGLFKATDFVSGRLLLKKVPEFSPADSGMMHIRRSVQRRLIAHSHMAVCKSSSCEVSERFATKRRIRLGLGYRQSYEFRYELIAIRDKTRDTLEGDVAVDANIIDFRFKWFF